jgi:hypothetical protein
MFYKFIPFLFILNIVFSYKNNNTPLYSKNFFSIQMSPKNMLDVLTSIKEYTIITDNETNKELVDLLNTVNKNAYFVNTNNLLDKDSMIQYLKEKYSHLDSGENLWIFYKGFILGSREVIYDVISKNKLK